VHVEVDVVLGQQVVDTEQSEGHAYERDDRDVGAQEHHYAQHVGVLRKEFCELNLRPAPVEINPGRTR
jgi:hypothetical protein